MEASARKVDPELVEDFPVPVQKDRLRGTVPLPNLLKRGEGATRCRAKRKDPCGGKKA